MIKFENNPVDYDFRITSPYAFRNHPITGNYHHHSGNDIAPSVRGKEGDPIYSVADGKVVISKADNKGVDQGAGYYILIEHDGFCTRYVHLMGLDVKVGQRVKAGEQVGRMGNTGSSTAPHLHFEVFRTFYTPEFFVKDSDGVKRYSVDPKNYYIKELNWKQILSKALDSPEKWIPSMEALVEMAEHYSDLGDLEVAKYFPEMIVKIYEAGRNS